MATTTKKAEAVEEVKVNEAGWDQKVMINVPRATDGTGNFIIASVNGRVFKVQRGVNVEVPAPIAEVIQHSFEAENEAVAFIDSHTH